MDVSASTLLLSSTMILETLLMVSLKLTWMSQEVRVFLPFTLGLPGLSGWERAEIALESAATSGRKETKPDISCNILPNISHNIHVLYKSNQLSFTCK